MPGIPRCARANLRRLRGRRRGWWRCLRGRLRRRRLCRRGWRRKDRRSEAPAPEPSSRRVAAPRASSPRRALPQPSLAVSAPLRRR
jgi:hypothetical protein